MRDLINLLERYVTQMTTSLRGSSHDATADVFRNPSSKELQELRQGYDNVRAILCQNGDFIAWAHHIFHHGDVLIKLDLIEDSNTFSLTFTDQYVAFYCREWDDEGDAAENLRRARIIYRNRYVRALLRSQTPQVQDQNGYIYPQEQLAWA